VRWIVERLAQQGIKLGDEDPTTPASAAVTNTADEYFIVGFNKWVEPGDDIRAGKQQAIQAFSQTIRLNPRYTIAYFLRAFIYAQLKEYRLSLSDYNQAIALKPNFALAYNNRGVLKAVELNDAQGALADYNQAIALDPNYANAYGARGRLKYTKLNDLAGGIADVQKAAELARAQGNTAFLNYNLKILQSWGVR
jgi:tetratricopeptide (TPR) repeat protein